MIRECFLLECVRSFLHEFRLGPLLYNIAWILHGNWPDLKPKSSLVHCRKRCYTHINRGSRGGGQFLISYEVGGRRKRGRKLKNWPTFLWNMKFLKIFPDGPYRDCRHPHNTAKLLNFSINLPKKWSNFLRNRSNLSRIFGL